MGSHCLGPVLKREKIAVKERNRFSLCLSVIVLGVFLCQSFGFAAQQGQSEEGLGQAAERAGKLREALTHYVAALQSATEGSEADQRLREKIISLAQKMRPAPVVSEEARRHFVIGNSYMKDAKAPQDYNQAIAEYKKALLAAPWFADAYNNLGIALEAAGSYAEAKRVLNLYLETKPSAADSRSVQDKIYEIEAKQSQIQQAQQEAEERQKAEARQRQAAEEQSRRERQRLAEIFDSLPGQWSLSNCGGGCANTLRKGELRTVGNGRIEERTLGSNCDGTWSWSGWSWTGWHSHYWWYDPRTGRIVRHMHDSTRGDYDEQVEYIKVVSPNELAEGGSGSICHWTR